MGQVLTTHLDRIRRNEAAQTIPDTDDEKVRQIGKSNLDKWLQVLLFKDVDSGGSSPGQESPLHRALSPALSQMSIAAMRGSMELQASRDQVKELLTQHASSFLEYDVYCVIRDETHGIKQTHMSIVNQVSLDPRSTSKKLYHDTYS